MPRKNKTFSYASLLTAYGIKMAIHLSFYFVFFALCSGFLCFFAQIVACCSQRYIAPKACIFARLLANLTKSNNKAVINLNGTN